MNRFHNFSGRKIDPPTISGDMDIRDLVEYFGATGFNARRLYEALQITKQMINEGACICLTLAGALAPIGLGRAIGETMLVTLIIGNATGLNAIPTSLFSQSQTLSSLIANEFNEAASELHLSALIGLGAVLLLLTLIINVIARLLVYKMVKTSNPGGRI